MSDNTLLHVNKPCFPTDDGKIKVKAPWCPEKVSRKRPLDRKAERRSRGYTTPQMCVWPWRVSYTSRSCPASHVKAANCIRCVHALPILKFNLSPHILNWLWIKRKSVKPLTQWLACSKHVINASSCYSNKEVQVCKCHTQHIFAFLWWDFQREKKNTL